MGLLIIWQQSFWSQQIYSSFPSFSFCRPEISLQSWAHKSSSVANVLSFSPVVCSYLCSESWTFLLDQNCRWEILHSSAVKNKRFSHLLQSLRLCEDQRRHSKLSSLTLAWKRRTREMEGTFLLKRYIKWWENVNGRFCNCFSSRVFLERMRGNKSIMGWTYIESTLCFLDIKFLSSLKVSSSWPDLSGVSLFVFLDIVKGGWG